MSDGNITEYQGGYMLTVAITAPLTIWEIIQNLISTCVEFIMAEQLSHRS